VIRHCEPAVSITGSVFPQKNRKMLFSHGRSEIVKGYDDPSQFTLLEFIAGRSGTDKFFCQLPVGCQIADNNGDKQKDK